MNIKIDKYVRKKKRFEQTCRAKYRLVGESISRYWKLIVNEIDCQFVVFCVMFGDFDKVMAMRKGREMGQSLNEIETTCRDNMIAVGEVSA